MLKADTRVTALEILQEAKVPEPDKAFGKMRIVIGGIMGIVKPDHVIHITTETKKLEVVVGVEKYTVKVK